MARSNALQVKDKSSSKSSSNELLNLNRKHYPQDTTIFPIQLLDRDPRSSSPSRLIPSSVPEIHFEELRFYSNLSTLSRPQSSSQDPEEQPDSHDDFQALHGASEKARGKRKASENTSASSYSRANKRSKPSTNGKERNDVLARTSLLFSLQPDDSRSDLSASPGPGPTPVKLTCRGSDRGSDSFISHIVSIFTEGGELLVDLPIFDSFQVEPSRSPQSFTNGDWIASAIALEIDGVLEIEANVSLRDRNPWQPDEQGLFLEMGVELLLPSAAFEPAPSNRVAEHWLYVMRFCNPGSQEKEEQRRLSPDASMIYSSLKSAQMDGTSDLLQPSSLHSTLMPFQRKAVEFMSGREGKFLNNPRDSGKIQTTRGASELGLFYEKVDDGLYFQSLDAFFTRDSEKVQESNVSGGIFAEEMGLGKTVEVFALVLLNQSPERSSLPPYYSENLSTDVTPCSATLIVAPETLRQQWIDEAALHAPSLKVYSYSGHLKAGKDAPPELSWPQWIARDFDLVVVSFPVLQKEVHVAKKDESMARRRAPKYERSRSPLVQTEFSRVIMDEVQLMGPNSRAAQTVSMIARRSSIAVSGTLVKQASDLLGTFNFLQIPLSNAGFQRLLSPMMCPTLTDLLQTLATRTTKSQVQSELIIPSQVRKLISLDFNGIETAFYHDVMSNFYSDTGCDETGTLAEGRQWNPAVLATHLTRLRQACTHPQVVGRALGGKLSEANSNLRSIDEVLSTMLDTLKSDLNGDRILLVKKKIHGALLVLGDRERKDRLEASKVTLENSLPEVKSRIAALDGEIRLAWIKGPTYDFSSEIESQKTLKSGGKDGDPDQDLEQNREEESSNRAKAARAVQVSALKNRQRDWIEQLHRLHQFLGMIYFQKGEAQLKGKEESKIEGKDQDQEVEDEKETDWKTLEDTSYADAEATRQILLAEHKKSVDQCLSALDAGAVRLNLKLEEFDPPQEWGPGGIASSVHFDELNELCSLLFRNAELIFDWKAAIISRLRLAVNRDVSQENEDDDQYQENLDAQVEAETFLEMIRIVTAEREKIICGTTASGATLKSAVHVSLERQIQNLKRQRLQVGLDEDAEEDEGEKVVKQQLDHFKQLEQLRSKVKLKEGQLSVEGIVTQLREVAERSAEAETAIAREGIFLARNLIKEQNLALSRLRKEITAMTNLFNARAAYFKSVQELSDQVSDVVSTNVEKDLEKIIQEEIDLMRDIGRKEERIRYLVELQKASAVEEKNEEARNCFICTDKINTGSLTPCGHLTCETCFKNWTRTNPVCPVCRQKIKIVDTHRIVYRKVVDSQPRKDESQSQKDESQPQVSSNGSSNFSFNEMKDDDKSEILRIPIRGRYGTKLDFLVQFLLSIERTSDDKTLVFSSFSRGLDFASEALRRNAISHVRLEGGGKQAGLAVEKFRNDSNVNVLLLHSESQSSGLNLLCATNVIILEPLVNHALELQAISRVSRIGATRESKIYTLYVKDTVEERILELAARRGRSLYLQNRQEAEKETDVAILDVKSRGTNDPKTSKGDFVSDLSDLISCLFDEKLFNSSSFPSLRGTSSHQTQAQADGSASHSVDDFQTGREERARAAARAAEARARASLAGPAVGGSS